MLKNDEKQLALRAVRTAKQHVIDEQASIFEEIEQLLTIPLQVKNAGEDTDNATVIVELANSTLNVNHPWLPAELDQIPDVELRGALGIYSAALCQLEHLRASRDLLRAAVLSS
jgi:hypothetical protein